MKVKPTGAEIIYEELSCWHSSKCFLCFLLKECSYLYLLFNGTCKATCPDGYYEDLDAGRCVSCHISCETCSGPADDDCETCPPASSKLYQGRCLTSCPTGTFYNSKVKECQGMRDPIVNFHVIICIIYCKCHSGIFII